MSNHFNNFIYVKKYAFACFLTIIAFTINAQIYSSGPPSPFSLDYQNIYMYDENNCSFNFIYDDRIRGNNFVGFVSEVAIEPNTNTIFLLNNLLVLYEHDDSKRYFKEVRDLYTIWPIRGGPRGMVFDLDSNLYLSSTGGICLYNIKGNSFDVLTQDLSNYSSSVDLTFYNGSLYGTSFNGGSNILKYDNETFESEVFVNLDTVPGNSVPNNFSFFDCIYPVANYCDSSLVFVLHSSRNGNANGPDSVYYYYADENYMEAVCPKPVTFGTGTASEALFSEPCIVYIDLDSNNTSGLPLFDYRDTTYCYLQGMPISDIDVDVRSPFLVDSIRVCLAKSLDVGQEFLEVSSAIPSSLSWRAEDDCIWLINRGTAELEDYEEAIRAITLNHSGTTYREGLRRVDVIGFAGGDSGRVAESYLYALDPIQSLGPDVELRLCEGQEVTLTDRIPDFSELIWSQNAAAGRYTASDIGLDTAYVVNEQTNCPNDTLYFFIETFELPTWEQEIPIICPSKSIEITLDIDTTQYLSVWYEFDTSYTQFISPGIGYAFDLINKENDGCRRIYEFFPQADEQEIIRLDTFLCPDAPILFQDSLIESPGIYTFTEPDTSANCPDALELSVYRAPDTDLLFADPDSCFWDVVSLTINADRISNIQWSTGSRDSSILIGEEGEYTVQYTYADQCDYEERIRVIACEGSVIYIPNVFTPNGDGINDFFMAEGERFQVEQLHVFDRYGNKVFETNESFIGWDGTFRGKEVSEGVYTYRLSYFNARGEAEVEFGSITLVR